MQRLVDGLLISTLVLTACGDDGSSASTSSTDGSSADTSSSSTETGRSAAEYPLVTEYVEVYAGTNCPDILTLDQPRFVFQPSGINQSDAVYEIGETLGDRALILVDAQGAILEILPCP